MALPNCFDAPRVAALRLGRIIIPSSALVELSDGTEIHVNRPALFGRATSVQIFLRY